MSVMSLDDDLDQFLANLAYFKAKQEAKMKLKYGDAWTGFKPNEEFVIKDPFAFDDTLGVSLQNKGPTVNELEVLREDFNTHLDLDNGTSPPMQCCKALVVGGDQEIAEVPPKGEAGNK